MQPTPGKASSTSCSRHDKKYRMSPAEISLSEGIISSREQEKDAASGLPACSENGG
jgi:hypothetical protein